MFFHSRVLPSNSIADCRVYIEKLFVLGKEVIAAFIVLCSISVFGICLWVGDGGGGGGWVNKIQI